tara:strand:+ start:682 stop:1293 length:612 start_codon:yes stop_codon:yes gene_type:complete
MSTTPINSITFKAVAADTNSIASSQTTSEAADLTLSSASVNDGSNMASTVTIKSLTADNSSITFNVQGTDANGDAAVELTITGPGAGATVTTSTAFLTVTTVRANAAIPGTVEVGFTATTTTTGIVFAGATRVRGMHGVSSSTAGAAIIREASQTGSKLLEIDTPAAAGQVDPYIPDEGIRYRQGAYIDIGAGYDSATIFFDG